MVEIRQTRDEADEERSLAIYNAVWPRDAVTRDEVRSFAARASAYGDFLALVEGEAAGSAAIAVMPTRPNVALALLTVLPDRRRRGVGAALYSAASAWAAERDVGELEGVVPGDDAESLACATRRGFREVENNSRLTLDLTGVDPPAIDPPRRVEIVTYAERPALAPGIYEVACEAYPDIPGWRGTTMEPFDAWVTHNLHASNDRPEATFVAVVGDAVVGYAKLSFTAARPKDGEHEMTGVKRGWRGRGVAGALKRAQIAWAKRAGLERLQTQNELRNEPIRRLNERLGYRLEPGRVIVRGPLAATDSAPPEP